MGRLVVWSICICICAFALALTAGAAQASTVSVDGGVMTITAKPGEENDVDFGSAGSDDRGPLVRVIDSGSEDNQPNSTSRRIIPGGSCNQSSNGQDAFCPTNGLTAVIVTLGDEDDEYDGEGMDVNTTLDLGDGDDTGETARGSDSLLGGNGEDTLDGGGTNSGGGLTSGGGSDDQDTFDGGNEADTFEIGHSTKADDVRGGAGTDTVSYSSRSFAAGVTTGVTITVDDAANDGRQGSSAENDNIRTDIEKVIGSRNNDVLNGSTGPDVLEGGLGADSFKGNGGADSFRLRDGVRDNFFCVDSNDTVDKDLVDPLILHCALLDARPVVQIDTRFIITIGAIDEGPNVRVAKRVLRVKDDGSVRVRLRCPRKLNRNCSGRLTLSQSTRKAPDIGTAIYFLRPGKRGSARVELSERGERKALKRGVVGIEALERGKHGLKTTFAYRPIRD